MYGGLKKKKKAAAARQCGHTLCIRLACRAEALERVQTSLIRCDTCTATDAICHAGRLKNKGKRRNGEKKERREPGKAACLNKEWLKECGGSA